MPVTTRSNKKRSLAESDPNAETAPSKTPRASAEDNKENVIPHDEQPKEKCDGCGKECPSNQLVTQPVTKPRLGARDKGGKAVGRKKSMAKKEADAHDVREKSKAKEVAEEKEKEKEKEKAVEKEGKAKEKTGKKGSGNEKADSSSKKTERKTSSSVKDGRLIANGPENEDNSLDSLAQVTINGERVELQPKAELRAMIEQRRTAFAKQDTEESAEWVCICRLLSDLEAEHGYNVKKVKACGTKKCMCNRPIDRYPDYTWKSTKAGKEAFHVWYREQLKRDQDIYDINVNGDFPGWAITEVMENQLVEFNKEFKKKQRSAIALWSQLEGIAFYLHHDIDNWFCSDSSEQMAEIVTMYGTALLSTIDILLEQDLFKKDSSIRNLGLILSLFIKFTGCIGDLCQDGEDDWKKDVFKIARRHGIELKGPYAIKDYLDPVEETIEDEETDIDNEWEDIYDWKKSFTAYSRKWRPVGGTECDISRWSKRERKEYEY